MPASELNDEPGPPCPDNVSAAISTGPSTDRVGWPESLDTRFLLWRKEQVDRGQADIFATKVRRKGKNALGLMISIEGFAQTALDQYAEATPFLSMDGSDLFMVLDQRVRLD